MGIKLSFDISKDVLTKVFSQMKEHLTERVATPIARKLGKSVAEIKNEDGNIVIEGRFISSTVNLGKAGITPEQVGEALSVQVEQEITLTFVTRGDSRVCQMCESFEAEHGELSTADPKDVEILNQYNIMVELERQPMPLHERCRCQVVRGVEKRAK